MKMLINLRHGSSAANLLSTLPKSIVGSNLCTLICIENSQESTKEIMSKNPVCVWIGGELNSTRFLEATNSWFCVELTIFYLFVTSKNHCGFNSPAI